MRTLNALAATAGFMALAGVAPAHALSTTNSVSFSNSSTVVTDMEGGSSTTSNNVDLGSSTVSQFNSSVGVLTGASVRLESTRKQITNTSSPASTAMTGSNGLVTSTGAGYSSAKISAPGNTSTTFSQISGSDTCTGHKRGSCSDGFSSTEVSTFASIVVDQNKLNNYVGNGAVNINREAPSITANLTSPAFTAPNEEVSTSVTWAGTVGMQYDYLLHADPLIDGSQSPLVIDFGSVYEGDSIASVLFNIGNGVGLDTVGLDLDSITSFGASDILQTNLNLFTSLASGGSLDFLASFDTSAVGVYLVKYILNFSDADIGASDTRFSYSREVDIYGEVLKKQIFAAMSTSVPEPDSSVLLLAGFFGFFFLRRKNNRFAEVKFI